MTAERGEKSIVLQFVSSEYFLLLRIPLAQGRLWSRDEIARVAPMAVISQTMAWQYWPNGDDRPAAAVREHEGRATLFTRL